jgi:teichuronic acid biosynthesis glycosyltransferase TuaG
MYTVIIPSIGRINFLNELLGSIENQTEKPSEILILLDETSNKDFLLKNIVKIKNAKIIFCKKMNLAQKRNFGAKISMNENILYSDDDDIWHKNKGKICLLKLNRYAVCCHNFSKFGFDNKTKISKLGISDKIISFKNLFYGDNIFGGGSSLVCKKTVVQLFPFNSTLKFSEDFEWWVRIFFSGIPIFYIGKSLVNYRTHNNNMTHSYLGIFLSNISLVSKFMVLAFKIFLFSALLANKNFFSFIYKKIS